MATCVRTIDNGSLCGQPVSNGGNKHPIGHCRTARHGTHHRAKMIAKRHRRREQRENIMLGMDQRGVSVAGVGGGQAKTHRAGHKKADVSKIEKAT